MLLGRQTPTFQWRPECWSCAAVEAIELYESLGPRLDPWQKHCLELALGEDELGDWATPEVGLEVPRQNGKGGITEAVELTALFVWGMRVIIHTAHLIDTSKTAFKRTADLVEGSDDLIRRVKRINRTNGEEAIELLDGAVLKFRTRTGRGGRGLTGDMVVFDEAQELEPAQMEALVPTILARPNPMIVYTFTPPKLGQQFVTQLRRRARAKEPGLAYGEWANDAGADLSDPQVLARVNPAYGIRVTAKTLAIVRATLGEDGYARECGGIWPPDPDAEWQVISEQAWRDRHDPAAVMEGPRVLTVDVVPDRSAAAIASAAQRTAGGRMVAVVAAAPGVGWVVPLLIGLVAQRKPRVLVINDKAVADAAEAAGLKVYRPSGGDMVSACTGFYDAIAGGDPDTWHLGQPELTDGVAGAVKRILGAGKEWAWDRRLVAVNISPLVACTLALWAASTPRIHQSSRAPLAAYA
ncbi:MAG TPA: hypothetical protein VFM37_13530 [Pseudonocardiaceae bacterium]|nr:hypothetical protein [Pseudonocardiaceae bacterium]